MDASLGLDGRLSEAGKEANMTIGAMLKSAAAICVGFALAGCATREVGAVRPAPGLEFAAKDPPTGEQCAGGKTVWVTIDGTSNTPVSRTAAARLHEMVEAYSYTRAGGSLAIWYAEGVGSADHDITGKALGTGIDDDIKKAFAFLTRAWRPCDRLFLNGFSRGAYSVRALGGLLYMAGIPDLSGADPDTRKAIVDELFEAYKTRKFYSGDESLADRRSKRVAEVYDRYRLDRFAKSDRAAGFLNPRTRVTIDAMTVWDSVQALGRPDRSENPTEGPAHFLVTACNVKAIFQPLSLDDNRVYSFTPVLAGGAQATAACPDPGTRQNVSKAIDEVWFSGAHADVGGAYEAEAMLDGELASVSLNWVLERLRSDACQGCGEALALPRGLRLPENRLTAVHDGKRSSPAFRGLYRQSRKPLVHWYHVYRGSKPAALHPSVFDRLEWLFALDQTTPGCDGTAAPNKAVICAQEIAANSLVPELEKGGCLETTDWGYRLKPGQNCVAETDQPSRVPPAKLPICQDDGTKRVFTGMVYDNGLADTNRWVVRRVPHDIPFPRCMSGAVQATHWGRRVPASRLTPRSTRN
ncbi:MAG TPA: DUF2235 domain-containing protein [Allosphingosinicella sp.]